MSHIAPFETLKLPNLRLLSASGKNDINTPGLSKKDQESFFNGKVLIEEKISGIPKQFSAGRYILLGVDVTFRKGPKYTLPGRYVIHGVVNPEERLVLPRYVMLELVDEIRSRHIDAGNHSGIMLNPDDFIPIPQIANTHTNLNILPQFLISSLYSNERDRVYGILVKTDLITYISTLDRHCGQLISPEHENSKIRPETNIIDYNVPLIYEYPTDLIKE
ncbi:hypothetical protein KO465_04270 [Candidatus Micrarchaeota archaeon]|nr:hypothetical protein [Candidatus Micrarchaeota archaeon]